MAEKPLNLDQEATETQDLVNQITAISDGDFLIKAAGAVAGSAGTGLIDEPPIIKTDGSFFTTSGTPVVVPGTTIAFTLVAPGKVFVGWAGTINRGSSAVVHNQYVFIDGTPNHVGRESGNVSQVSVGGRAAFSLAAGPHTVDFGVDRDSETDVLVIATAANPFYFNVLRTP